MTSVSNEGVGIESEDEDEDEDEEDGTSRCSKMPAVKEVTMAAEEPSPVL